MERWRALLAVSLILVATACSPAWTARWQPMDANARSYLLALFTNDAGRYNAVASPRLSQAQFEAGNQYRGYAVLEGPTITGGPTAGHTPATSEYTAVVRARASSGLDYQFDFTVVLDTRSHLVTSSSARQAVLEPRPCCT